MSQYFTPPIKNLLELFHYILGGGGNCAMVYRALYDQTSLLSLWLHSLLLLSLSEGADCTDLSVVLEHSKLVLTSGPLLFLFLLPGTFPPDNDMACYTTPFTSLFKCHLPREAFSDYPTSGVCLLPDDHSPVPYPALVFFLALSIIWFGIYLLVVRLSQ